MDLIVVIISDFVVGVVVDVTVTELEAFTSNKRLFFNHLFEN